MRQHPITEGGSELPTLDLHLFKQHTLGGSMHPYGLLTNSEVVEEDYRLLQNGEDLNCAAHFLTDAIMKQIQGCVL